MLFTRDAVRLASRLSLPSNADVCAVEAALIALQAVVDDDALLVEVVERRAIVRLLRAAGERELWFVA